MIFFSIAIDGDDPDVLPALNEALRRSLLEREADIAHRSRMVATDAPEPTRADPLKEAVERFMGGAPGLLHSDTRTLEGVLEVAGEALFQATRVARGGSPGPLRMEERVMTREHPLFDPDALPGPQDISYMDMMFADEFGDGGRVWLEERADGLWLLVELPAAA